MVAEDVRQMSVIFAWLQAAAPIIAPAALLLSLGNLILQRWDKRPKLVIEGSYGVVTNEPGPLYLFTVKNPKDRTVTLNNVSVGITKGRKLIWGTMRCDPPLPTKLAHGDRAICWVPLDHLKDTLKDAGYRNTARVTLQAHDALGKTYKKRRTKIVLDPS